MGNESNITDMMKMQQMNWNGSIPVALSLAPSSLSSPTMPPPIHCMVSRQTYLHVALEDAVKRFQKYAPVFVKFLSVDQTTGDDDENGNNSKGNMGTGQHANTQEIDENDAVEKKENTYPICWFEDEETGIPLRWHFFVGILYDLIKLKCIKDNNNHTALPWRIRVHYTSYPEIILPLEEDEGVCHHIFRHYLNSLKQSLFIQHNSNRVVNNMSKQSHLQLWDGIKRSQFEVYKEIAMSLNGSSSSINEAMVLEHVPVRVLVDGQPAFTRPCKQYNDDKEVMTIGNVLYTWLPALFGSDSTTNDITDDRKCNWCVQGVKVPLNVPISELWKGLCHPDRFLYIIVITNM